ncbi:MAG TPA: hypothetical protein VHF25_06865 [Nitriliruptorales bacterium]|nr:hypothetical protein [Nitriliruptorales bacterium]
MIGVAPRLLIAAMLWLATQLAHPAAGALLAVTSSTGNAWNAGSLQPPTGVTAAAGCQLLVLGPQVTVSWTATASPASGYSIRRSSTSGGPYTQVGTVSGAATTSFTDTSVSSSRTYYYVVQSSASVWSSANSNQARATTPGLCL